MPREMRAVHDEAVLEEIMSEPIRPILGVDLAQAEGTIAASLGTMAGRIAAAPVGQTLTGYALEQEAREAQGYADDGVRIVTGVTGNRYEPGRARYDPAFFLREYGPVSAGASNRPNEAPVWMSGNGGRYYLPDMETSHVKNTIAYLAKRMKEWRVATDQAMIRKNFSLGPLVINGKEADEWFDLFIDELAKREQQL